MQKSCICRCARLRVCGNPVGAGVKSVQAAMARPRGDGQVESRGAVHTPVGPIDIGRPATIAVLRAALKQTILVRAGWQEPRLLNLGMEASGLRPCCQNRAQAVVTLSAVASAPKPVGYSVAEGTGRVGQGDKRRRSLTSTRKRSGPIYSAAIVHATHCPVGSSDGESRNRTKPCIGCRTILSSVPSSHWLAQPLCKDDAHIPVFG